MTNVLARSAVVCSLLLLVGCGGGGSNNVNTGVCSAGEFRCSGDVLETCSVDRTGFTTVATCMAGLCDAAGKQCDNCKAGEGTCTGVAAGKICSADGQKLEDVTCTGASPFCVASGKAAVCVACRTSVDCAISSNPCQLSVCRAEGTCGSVAVAADTACSASGGKCDGAGNCRECQPGQKRCTGIQPEVCSSAGSWSLLPACQGASAICNAGECVQCISNGDCPVSGNQCTQAVCTGGQCGYTVKPQGSTCAGGTCTASGLCNGCTPGTKVCNGDQVLTCGTGGQYGTPVACGGSTPYCENATANCVQCTSVAQCAVPTNPCQQSTCASGTCGVVSRVDGTPCSVGGTSGTCSLGTCVGPSAGDAVTKVVGGVSFEFSYVPAGTYQRGAPGTDGEAAADERPQHSVTLTKAFLMARSEVTQAQYQAVMGSNPSAVTTSGTLPVENLTWSEAVAFCDKLSQLEGVPAGTYRLPTEAEWEYAARAGTTTPRYGVLDSIGWYAGNSLGMTRPVKTKAPNAWNLYDMLGNVQEWTRDYYGVYGAAALTDPAGPQNGSGYTRRGGNVNQNAEWSRASARDYGTTTQYKAGYVGFRIARNYP